MEVRHGRRAALRSERTARHAALHPDYRGPLRRLPVEPRGGRRHGILRIGRRPPLRARCRFRRTALEVQDWRRGPRLPGICRRHVVLRQLGQLLLRRGRCHRQGEVALPRRRRRLDSQSGRLSIVARRGGRSGLHRLPRFQRLRARCRHRPGEVARQQSGKLGQQFTRRGKRQSLFRHVGFQPLSGSGRRHRKARLQTTVEGVRVLLALVGR